MHTATLRFATFFPSPFRAKELPSRGSPTSRRVARALRRALPTRRVDRDFHRYYARLLANRQKILFTRYLAALRH